MRHLWGVVFVVAASSCLDTQLPTVPIVGPGTLRATLVSALPNRQDLSPAKGATVTLVGTTLRATADDEGNVLLTGITARTGRVLFSFDADGDGTAERSKVVTLEAVRAGFGKDVNLGQLVLGRNATLVGTVKRGDRVQLNAGHGGIAVFLPQLPQLSYTGDDGSFSLGGVPEGNVVLSTFATGYRSEATPIDVGASREERVGLIVLEPAPGSAAVGQLSGRVEQADGTPIPAVQVRTASRGTETVTQTNAEGRFVFETLQTGVYALALSKTGLVSLKVDSVLVNAGLNQVGPYVMTEGMSATGSLDGGPSGPPDAGSMGGGTAGGGTAGGGTAGGGTAGGGTAGGGTAGGGTAGGGTAGGGTAGGGSAGGGSAGGGSTGGGSAAGGSAAGGTAGGGTAGGAVGAPVAAAGLAQIVTPGVQVTLNGMASSGDFPLRYAWTQLPGSATVTLSDNNTITAHSPRFTAPAAGTVLDFSLVVTDRFGFSSTNLATTRISCGSTPTARFTPDGGLFAGGQTVPFQSAAFDDAGLLIVRHDWLGSGSVASVISDGGPTAYVTFNPVAFMAADELASVELRVTNAIGATSAPFSRTFVVRGANPNNWSLDAGTAMFIPVGASPPLVSLIGSVAPTTAAPTFSWSCAPPLPLLNPNSLAPQFFAPVIAGPSRTFVCSMNATGAPPLNPSMLSTSVAVTLRDVAEPFVLSTSLRNGRVSPFGWITRFSEPVIDFPTLFGNCASNVPYAPRLESWGSNAIMAPRSILPIGLSCGPYNVQLTDRAVPANSTPSNVSVSGPVAVVVGAEWLGPWVSSTDFADPRPVVATMGPMPKEEQLKWSPSSMAPPFELIAREGAALVRSSELDPLVLDAGCGLACSMTFQSIPLAGLSASGPAPSSGHRAFFGGGSLFVALESTDGGVAGDLVSRRNSAGSWLPPTATTGSAFQIYDSWSQVRVAGGSVFRDAWDGASGTVVGAELVATGVPEVTAASGTRDYVALAAGPTRALSTWGRSGVTWTPRTTVTVTDIVRMAALESAPPSCAGCGPDLPFVVVERSTSPQLQAVRLDTSGFSTTIANAGVTGWSFAVRGGQQLVAVSINGDVRLLVAPTGSLTFSDFNGPPRPGFPSPPPPLDVDVLCEAVHPHLAFIEDALVVTWQERCSPQTRWRIAARVIR